MSMTIGVLSRAFGHHLVVEPFNACALQASRMIADLGTAAQRDAWLPALMEGRARASLAHDEVALPGPWATRTTVARRTSTGWELTGTKLLAVGAPGAQVLLVTARLEDRVEA
ncbi:MAG: acyl-CoA dehydrogenase, partial [Gemmatimonadota bacterium]